MLVLNGGRCIDQIVSAGCRGYHTLSLLFSHPPRLVMCRVAVDGLVVTGALIVGGAGQYFARGASCCATTTLHHGCRLSLLELLLLLLTAGL